MNILIWSFGLLAKKEGEGERDRERERGNMWMNMREGGKRMFIWDTHMGLR